jgi:F-box interacting protein
VKTVYGFGYDHLIDKYKVVAVSMYICYRNFTLQDIQVNVHTSGTNSWRLIQKFPPVTFYNNHLQSGIFVSGTINWLVRIGDQPIVSLDLGTESYQQILYPDQVAASSLVVLRDCLCILARHGGSQMVSDIWLMKEYGNRESWIKLASVPDLGWINNVLYISEDDQVLLEISNDLTSELVVYHPINGTLKIQDSENFNDLMFQGIYVESLISPCS